MGKSFLLYTISMQHPLNRYFLKVTGICVFLIAIGFLASIMLDHRIDLKKRALLIQDVKQLGLLVDSSDIANLKADETDLSNPEYMHLKKVFTEFRATDSQIRFAYVLGLHEVLGKQFFYVDSEDATSKDYSPPGQIYTDTATKDIAGYLSGVPYTEGPYHDSWGEWISGYAPIKDAGGTIVAQIGVDVSTASWHQDVLFANLIIGFITLLLTVITILLAGVFYRKQQKVNELLGEKKELMADVANFKSVQLLAHLGRITISFPAQLITLDEQFASLFPNGKVDSLSFNMFRACVHPDDILYLEKMIEEIRDGVVSYTWCDIRFGNQQSGFRQYHIYGNVKKENEGNIVFAGIIQDITDIKS